jgi:hypothetical protein
MDLFTISIFIRALQRYLPFKIMYFFTLLIVVMILTLNVSLSILVNIKLDKAHIFLNKLLPSQLIRIN